MDKTDLSLLLSAVGVVLALGASASLVLAALVAYLTGLALRPSGGRPTTDQATLIRRELDRRPTGPGWTHTPGQEWRERP